MVGGLDTKISFACIKDRVDAAESEKEGKDESSEPMTGFALREFKRFLEGADPDMNYGGLQKVEHDELGAVWVSDSAAKELKALDDELAEAQGPKLDLERQELEARQSGSAAGVSAPQPFLLHSKLLQEVRLQPLLLILEQRRRRQSHTAWRSVWRQRWNEWRQAWRQAWRQGSLLWM